MNLVYDNNKNTLRINGYEETVGLQKLNFYIPRDFGKTLFLVLKNTVINSISIMQLGIKEKDSSNKFWIYAVQLSDRLDKDMVQGEYEISIMYFQNSLPIVSNTVTIERLQLGNFRYYYRTYFLSKIAIDIADKYDKIVKLTELNAEMLGSEQK